MNNTAKVLLLVAAIVAAVFTVGYYAKRITAPPMQTSFPNVHLASLRTDLKRLDGKPSMEVADSVFNTTLHAARYFQREGLVTTKESDDVITRLVKAYTPFFLASAKEHFGQSTWAASKNFELRRRAKLLGGLRRQDDHKAILDDATRANVDSVSAVINAYDDAMELANKVAFTNVDAVRQRLRQADAYTHMSQLRNCSGLMERLKSMRSRTEQSHYAYVKSKVDEMADYDSYSETYYRNYVAVAASNAINEYKSQAYSLYGTQTSLDRLEELQKKYWEAALEHYNRQNQDDNNNSWW